VGGKSVFSYRNLIFALSYCFVAYGTTDIQPIVFPPGFLKGVAFSMYQNGGHNYWPKLGLRPESNWTWFENNQTQWLRIDRRKRMVDFLQPASPIDYGQKVGISADAWNHLFEDIALMKELGVNSVRFELPWTDLNPQSEVWNEQAFQLFDRYIDALLKEGIEPMVTLYHFVHPYWFDQMGGWVNGKNIRYFVRYCKEVFKRFGHKVHYFCTINEPTVISACGYILGSHAPGVRNNYNQAGLVLGHLLKAHVRVYTALKKMPCGDQAKIGLVHQLGKFEALERTFLAPLHILSSSLASWFNRIFANKNVLQFFTTGEFTYYVGNGRSIGFRDKRACTSLDFIGLNFYANVTLGPWPTCKPGEIMTDMVWAMQPRSTYKAIREVAGLNVPIIITENGIPDAKDDRRAQWILAYTKAVKKALKNGYDVRGYMYWSLLDNYEWNMGHDKKFGLYAVDTASDDPAQKTRSLREGAKIFRDYVKVATLPIPHATSELGALY
jgi:beta-glucosidase